MPVYTVTDPQSGKTIKLTGDSPPTEQELNDIFAGLQPVQQSVQSDVPTAENLEQDQFRTASQQQQTTPDESLLGGLEALATTATGATTGALGFGLGTLEGAVGELTGRLERGEGEKVAKKYASLMTFEPRTEAGQKIVKELGEFAGALPPTIIPGAPAATQNLGLASKFLGNKLLKNKIKTKNMLADEIKSGNINAGNITKTIDDNGQLITNPNTKKAIKLMGDGDEAYSTAINFENMNNETRAQGNLMLDKIQANKDSGDPVQIMNNRPAQVIGDSMAVRINKLDDIKKTASKEVGKVVDGPIGQRPVNVSSARNKFIKSMQNSDIDIGVDDSGRLIANTERTLTNIDEVINTKKLNNILGRLQSGKMTAKEAHKIKRNIRELVDFDQTAPGAIKVSAEIEKAVKQLATDLGDSVSAISPKYKKANLTMSGSLDALKEADRMLGNTLLIGDDLAPSKFGSLAKRLGTNLASREQVKNLLTITDDALAKSKVFFKDDIEQQVALLADLEKIFKVESAQAPFGFQARIAQGAGEAMAGKGVLLQGAEKALDKFREMSKLEFDDKMKALRALSKAKRVTTND